MAYIRKRAGRWRAEVALRKVRDSETFDSRAEAVAWATRREADILEGSSKARAGLWTVGDAMRRYAEEVSPTKRGARWERVRLAKMTADALASIRLRSLTAADVAAWRGRRLRQVQPGSVIREMGLLRSVIEIARREWGWIADNPMKEVRRPPAPPARDRRISDDEAARICAALGWTGGPPTNLSHEVAIMFLLAIETGMRAGELEGLEPARVNLPARYVQLDRTKNGSARQVPLTSRAIELFGLLPMTGRRVFSVAPGSRDVLFRKARDRAGIEGLRFHDTRHEAITRLARRLDVLDLARMVGHHDLRSLRAYYNATATEIAHRLG